MGKPDNQNTTPFDDICHRIFIEHPEAIGVAFKWLDCGCSLVCGVSTSGKPVGLLVHVDPQAAAGSMRANTCPHCRKDSGLERVVWQGIHWPGTPDEYPDKALRIAIGREVFGPGYSED